jgi:multicomponent K+:H+ antiporter subunit G
MPFVAELAVSLLIVIGGIFALVGSVGLLKLPQFMMRLHGPTKATTLGVGSVLIASMVYFLVFRGQISIHELAITLFLFVTAPVSANFLAKAFLHLLPAGDPQLPAPPSTEVGWATFDPPHDERVG